MTEDEVYEIIDIEINTGQLNRAIWTRAFADADGDESKAKARYIKLRAAQLLGQEAKIQERSMPVKAVYVPEFNSSPKSIYWTITENISDAFVVTDPQKAEMYQIGKQCLKKFSSEEPWVYKWIMDNVRNIYFDGRDGTNRFGDSLKELMRDLKDVAEKSPSSGTSSSSECCSELFSKASLYLAVDAFRVRQKAGLFASKGKRDFVNAENRHFDRLAWIAYMHYSWCQKINQVA